MARNLIIITQPISVVAGGWLRSYKVLPYLVKELRPYFDNISLYIPFNGIKYAITQLVISSYDYYDYEDIRRKILNNIRTVTLETGIRIPTDEIEDKVQYAYDTVIHELKTNDYIRKIMEFGPLFIRNITKPERFFANKFLKNIDHAVNDIYIYTMHEDLYSLFLMDYISDDLTKRGNKVLAAQLLQLPVPLYLSSFNARISIYLSNTAIVNYARTTYEHLLRRKVLRLILGVSPAVFYGEGFIDMVRRYSTRIMVLKPANAVDREVLTYRRIRNKDLIATFYARLTPNKGIYELLMAWKIVEEHVPNAKLRIMGAFPSNDIKYKFLNLIKELKLRNVEYLGFIDDRNKLYELVSESKVLIYPSHEDAFPLVVLEALTLGVTVVAYGIPAIKTIYGGLPNLFIVPEGDHEALARKTIEVLRMADDEYERIHENEIVRRFLELHTYWENVAKAEATALREYLVSVHE